MDRPNPRLIADKLAAGGAVLTTWNSPAAHYLVGDFEWTDDQRVFWFAANGDTLDDAHVLRFDTAEFADGHVRFFASGRLVGQLSPIDRAEVDDRDDYRVAWSIWQQVAPVRRTLLAEARATHGAGAF